MYLCRGLYPLLLDDAEKERNHIFITCVRIHCYANCVRKGGSHFVLKAAGQWKPLCSRREGVEWGELEQHSDATLSLRSSQTGGSINPAGPLQPAIHCIRSPALDVHLSLQPHISHSLALGLPAQLCPRLSLQPPIHCPHGPHTRAQCITPAQP